VLEERVNEQVRQQYVWSPSYVDELTMRERDADANSSNGLEERLYAQKDANYNDASLIDITGAVLERFVYDSYGSPTTLNPDGSLD